MGLGRIAKQLNDEQVPPPRSTAGWCPTAIRELLLRPLHRGLIVWGELQKYENRGTKKRRRRLANDLIQVEAPHLRIVPEDLWAAVQERFQGAKRVSEQYQKRGIWRDRQSTYLLSGLARCAHCGGPIQGLSRDFVKRTGRTYGCVYHRKRGAGICQNALRIDQDRIDKALLGAIGEALDERILDLAIEKALLQLQAGDSDRMTRREAIERELYLIAAYEKNLVDAIAKGEQMDPLLAKLKAEESRKRDLIAELDRLTVPAEVITIDEARLKRELRTRISNAKGLLDRQRDEARQILRKLLDQPLRFEAFEDELGRKGYRVTGQGSYLQLLPSPLARTVGETHFQTAGVPNVVSPTGFEPVLPA